MIGADYTNAFVVDGCWPVYTPLIPAGAVRGRRDETKRLFGRHAQRYWPAPIRRLDR
ncbi:hypothetical protein [Nocardia vinacea]|uniref:hypothetical protein n=1 Tax=Nocardia vinacea TaxID=96468 RepID=UPI0002FE719E|nr:hypothetical protein [Nocardia vinacea]